MMDWRIVSSPRLPFPHQSQTTILGSSGIRVTRWGDVYPGLLGGEALRVGRVAFMV